MTVIATAGHVDHGKSSLVKALTGIDPDRFEEEQRRGLTIDLGFAHTTTSNDVTLSFIDVPGHVRFLRNMLAGVGAVGGCLFVVDASEGWKPQSEEHLRILQILGIEHAVVALTKVDLVDDDTRALLMLEVTERLGSTSMATAEVVPVSVVSGEGLETVATALEQMVQTVAVANHDRPRLWIDRVFAARGSGTVVTGTLTGGALSVDQMVMVLPHGQQARIRQMQTLGHTVEHIKPGQRLALNLAGIDHGLLHRGDVVVIEGQWRPTALFDAELEVLDDLGHGVSRRGAYTAYVGSREMPVNMRVLGPDVVAPGQRVAVRMALPIAVPLVPGDRFVLRESGRDETIGGGEVLDISPVLPAARARPDRSLERLVQERARVRLDELELLSGVRVSGEVLDWRIGPWVVTPDERIRIEERLLRSVAEAGSIGVAIAEFDELDRLVLAELDGVVIEAGRARNAGGPDPLEQHPVIEILRIAGCQPPDIDTLGIGRPEARELVRRGEVIEIDGFLFHPSAVDEAIAQVRVLLAEDPEGLTVSRLRERLGITRKHAIPLAAHLDRTGITRRRGDLRVAGPKLDREGQAG